MTLAPAVVVLPAFTNAEYTGDASEVAPWRDRYDFDRRVSIPGCNHELLYDGDAELALVPTGIGKSAAATTVATLAAGDTVDLTAATILSVGIAGCNPAAGTLGSVFVANRVVDGDIKLRIGETTSRMQWLVDDYVWQLDPDLVDRAVAATEDVSLADSAAAQEIRDSYDDSRSPTVDTGPTVCGDEVYHGTATAGHVEQLCASYGIDGFATTEMEDAGTVTALERFGLLDQYLSIRAASNFDREPPGGNPTESIERDVFELGTENAARVGHAVAQAFLG
ncbi:purine nucleoside permease [Haloarcula laminariae]|uniref:purine nucleoside permease n=1 Tax=Haloarcula laminariae TaxID=2961577 RepID=UPI0021C786D4|nr:purine nucleoside permease [Halomicroarcula laminariae]